MRTVVLAALGLLMIVPPVPAQDQPTGWAAKLFKDEKTQQIPPGHDFKTVPKGAMLQHRFPITNPYAVPLSITTDVSCTCVTVTPKTQVLQPKESGVIDIAMDTTRFNGQKTVNVYVKVQQYDPRPQFWSDTTLVIQGFCRGDVELAPAQAVFGAVPMGQAATRDLVVRYRGNQPGWQITGVVANPAAPFDVRHQEVSRRGGQAEYRVYLSLKADAPPGSYKGDLNLTTNDPNNQFVAVPYDAFVQAPLQVSPEVTRLGAIKVGGEAERRVQIRAGQPFRILGVDGQGEGVTAQPSRPDAQMVHVVTVKVAPAQAGPIQKSLTVRTDLGGGAGTAATVKVEAMAVAP